MSKTCTVKYLVVGDSGVGKTSLLLRYCQDTFQNQFLSTIGVDFKIKRIQLQGVAITLNIWDTAGQQRFRNITKSFYKGAHGIVLVYSITDPESYQHLQKWVDQIRQSGSQDTQMILVGAKSDMKNDRKVTYQQGSELAQKYGIKFVQTSSKQNNNVDQVFQQLTQSVVGNKDLSKSKKQDTRLVTQKKKIKKKNDDCCS